MKRILVWSVVAVVVGCPGRDKLPVIVRATDLARFYRDDPATASRVYGGRRVHLAMSNPARRGSEIHWHLASPDKAAVVVCQFDGEVPPVRSVLWVVGTCRGKVVDGQAREFPGYDFYVLVTDCQPADPPTEPGR